jgi:uncharacterized PurR-regulated membrane protein YhhQ (DUF165 family)
MVSLATALTLPGAWQLVAHSVFDFDLWPQWAVSLFGLSVPIGIVGLVVLLLARGFIKRLPGRLRGMTAVHAGLAVAGVGTAVVALILLLQSANASL